MRISIIILFVLICSIMSGQEVYDISLNGEWQFVPDSTNDYSSRLPANAQIVKIPHTWNIQNGLEEYAGKGWYQKEIEIKESLKDKAVYIHFGAVYHSAILYINGQKAGEHLHAGYTAFSFEISKYLKFGEKNTIIVSVDNEFSENNLPYMKSFDWSNDGGIIRDVSLHISDKPSFRYIHVTPDFNLSDSIGQVKIAIKLNESNINKADFNIVCKEKKSGKILFQEKKTVEKSKNIFTLSFKCGKITPWHFDNPFLYQINIETLNKIGIADTKTEKFGFRKLEIDGDKLYLNGEQIRLPGIETMPGSNPHYGAAEPREYLDSIVRSMKEANVVITRFHWPQDKYMLDLMDEYGILVQEEIPWWQKPHRLTPALMISAKKQLAEMIENHYNHPCIFAWGVSNEVKSNEPEISELMKFVQQFDATRMINITCDTFNKLLTKDPTLMGSFPAWNEYVGTWNGKDRAELPKILDRIEPALNGRPLFITELGLCEPQFAGGDRRRVDDMLYHIKEYYSKRYIAAFIYFSLNDYRTQMGEEGLKKYKIRRHGITDIYLTPKPSYFIFKDLIAPIEIDKVEKSNGTDITVGISVKNTIPSYSIRGYRLKYITSMGEENEIGIPTLKPGERMEFTLKKINVNYSFEVFRSTGFNVIKY